jgi:hypothetical protein
MPIAECGLKKKTKKIRNPQSEITRPMLFSRNALASGPQACFLAEKGTAKVKVVLWRSFFAIRFLLASLFNFTL